MRYHESVLLKQCIEGLGIKPGGTYVDVTYGGGGHSAEILKYLDGGRLIAFDQDADAMQNKIDDPRLTLLKQNFRYMKNNLKVLGLLPVDGILADLGVSSYQFDVAERGFSIRMNAGLDMRMNKEARRNAQEVLNTYEAAKLEKILREYGELDGAGKLARAIENAREKKPLKTIDELKDCLALFAPRGKENTFYAKVFQAIRIEVNDELKALQEFLLQSGEVLKKGGRLVVISYHSLEDRLVKNYIRSGNVEGLIEKDFFGNVIAPLKAVNRKPIVPTEQEIEKNNRARSAKLRIAEKI